MQMRAEGETWKTGRGSCGKGAPYRGASRQIRQARISSTSVASEWRSASMSFGLAEPRGLINWSPAAITPLASREGFEGGMAGLVPAIHDVECRNRYWVSTKDLEAFLLMA